MRDHVEQTQRDAGMSTSAPSRHLPDSEGYLGRRVEKDGSWTMYHVFTGVPARVDNRVMIGLTRAEATTTMMRRNGDPAVK